MVKTYKIRFIKNTKLCKVGDIKEATKRNAESAIKNGYAEYVVEKIEEQEKKAIVAELVKEAGIKKEPKTSKEMKIDFMLSQEKKPYKSMAIGEHNGHYYFGNILTYGGKKTPVVILDDGTIYWNYTEESKEGKILDYEIRDKFGLNYRYELFDECIENIWSNKSIKKFINGGANDISFKEMFMIIRDKNKELIYHTDKVIHDYVACDIISNYFYPLFEAKGRTYFHADYMSGKSKESMIYQLLSFNSVFASSITPAVFERIIESTGGTIIVDNFDNVNEDLKKDILQAIEVYYKKGGKNIKASGRNHRPEMFNGYSPLVINNIIGLPEVTVSRCNKIKMLRTDDKKILDRRIDEKNDFWSDTKDNLHILALQKWKEVKKTYEGLDVKELKARDLEKAEAVLTIAKLVGGDVYNNLIKFFVKIAEQEGIKEVRGSWEFILFEFLDKIVKKDGIDIKLHEITESLKSKIVYSTNTEKADKLKFSHYIGKILSSIPVFSKRIIMGYVHYKICRKDLDNVLKVKGFDKYLQSNTTNPLNTPNTLNTPNPTNNNNNLINNINNTDSHTNPSSVSSVSRVGGLHAHKNSDDKITEKLTIKPKDFSK